LCLSYLQSSDWNVEKAYAALVETLEWRFGTGDRSMRPQELTFADMRRFLSLFPCFVAGHGEGFGAVLCCAVL
jgi:hypothetical protein